MSESISFREVKLEGGWLMVKPEREDLGKAMSVVRKHKDRLYDLEVKEHRQKRSLDANAYAWVLINKISDALRITPKEIYRQSILNIGGNCEIIPIKEEAAERFKQIWESQGLGWPCLDMGKSKIQGYRNLRAYYGSKTYDTRQMSILIDNLIQDCKALDIETLPPEKLALLMEGWNA
ncbi:MAG: hypothetical protein ACI4WV_08055 [Eubacteriales bacterium]